MGSTYVLDFVVGIITKGIETRIEPQQSTTITRPEKLKFIHNSGLQYINEISDIKIATLGYDFILHQVLVSIFMHSVMQSGQLI